LLHLHKAMQFIHIMHEKTPNKVLLDRSSLKK
jgi:hypothetical protein